MIKDIKNKFNNKLFIIFSILCLIMIICPFFNVLKSGTQKLNYIYNDGEVADGVIVIILTILTYILSLFNFKKSSLIPLALLSVILVMLFIHLAGDNILKYATFNFYLMYVCLIGIIFISVKSIIKK